MADLNLFMKHHNELKGSLRTTEEYQWWYQHEIRYRKFKAAFKKVRATDIKIDGETVIPIRNHEEVY